MYFKIPVCIVVEHSDNIPLLLFIHILISHTIGPVKVRKEQCSEQGWKCKHQLKSYNTEYYLHGGRPADVFVEYNVVVQSEWNHNSRVLPCCIIFRERRR